MSPHQKKKEGDYIRGKWLIHKAATGDTQERFAAKLGVTQGTVQQIFRGDIAAPLEILLDMALELKFDPSEVRPDLILLQKKLNAAILGDGSASFDARLCGLPPALKQAGLEYLNYLESKLN